MNIWRLKALRLSVGLMILLLWSGVFSLFQPMTMTSSSMLDPATLEYEIDYVNMLICGGFGLLLGVFFLAITLSPTIRELAIAPARQQHYSARLFRFVGLILLAVGGIWILYSFVKPFG